MNAVERVDAKDIKIIKLNNIVRAALRNRVHCVNISSVIIDLIQKFYVLD